MRLTQSALDALRRLCATTGCTHHEVVDAALRHLAASPSGAAVVTSTVDADVDDVMDWSR